MSEIWKDAVGSEGKYLVSNYGRCAKVLKGWRAGRFGRYIYVTMYVRGNEVRKLLHRLILETFIGPPPTGKHEGNHKDGDTKNNEVLNLEWVTPSENRFHAYRVLGRKARSGTGHPLYGKYGKENPHAKEYIITDPFGNETKIKGLNQFCKSKGLDVGTMSNIAQGRRGCKSIHGWKCRHA